MWRHRARARPDWRTTVVEQGLVFPTTPMPDGSELPYWNEAAWYEVTTPADREWAWTDSLPFSSTPRRWVPRWPGVARSST